MDLKKIEEKWHGFYEWKKWYWEFMRRSPEYKADYKKVLALRKKAKYPPDYCEKRGNITEYPYWRSPEGEEERAYCFKYDLGYPQQMIDPEKSFADMSWEDVQGRMFLSRVKHGKSIKVYHRSPKLATMLIEIDFEKINSVDKAKSYIAHKIDEYMLIHPEPDKHRHKKNYLNILRAGDLKKEDPEHTADSIAAELFPKAKRVDSTSRKVGNWLREYDRLIEGGYKDLTFP